MCCHGTGIMYGEKIDLHKNKKLTRVLFNLFVSLCLYTVVFCLFLPLTIMAKALVLSIFIVISLFTVFNLATTMVVVIGVIMVTFMKTMFTTYMIVDVDVVVVVVVVFCS